MRIKILHFEYLLYNIDHYSSINIDIYRISYDSVKVMKLFFRLISGEKSVCDI